MLFYRFISENLTAYKLLDAIGDLNLGTFSENTIDAFGDAYEFLMTMFASSAAWSAPRAFTASVIARMS